MVCTANNLLGWRDFPKGLRVLLLDEDSSSAAEIRSKLEEMNYIVSTFCSENEALIAISNKPQSFHVAIVEVSTSNSYGRFTFLEVAKDLPTIMTSKIQCLNTMMKCIALGAVEFLLKPLSDDKLRNIWQHVVHKAFNAGGNDLSESLKPVKESVVSMLHSQSENGEQRSSSSLELETADEENGKEQSARSDEYPAPLTPQLKQGVTLVDDKDCQDHSNCSADKRSGDPDGESKFVDTICGNGFSETTVQASPPQILEVTFTKEEDESLGGSKSESDMTSSPQSKDGPNDSGGDAGNHIKASGHHNSCKNKANRKKIKVDWTRELHKKFVCAIEKLGVDQAIPSRILEYMKVEGLTRHNVASHLQKYRMQRRDILPKENDKRWPRPRDPSQKSYYPHKPIMPFPPYHCNPFLPASHVHPPWRPPSTCVAGIQTWGPAFYPLMQPAESCHWKPYPGIQADTWGCPVMPPQSYGPCPAFLQNNAARYHDANMMHRSYGVPHNSFDLHPAEEVIDRVVKEAISKPWLPLPLGLKPPSTDSVLLSLEARNLHHSSRSTSTAAIATDVSIQ
ncbi:Two-component response regulator-like [Sarracenia purpurea var. burkii]